MERYVFMATLRSLYNFTLRYECCHNSEKLLLNLLQKIMKFKFILIWFFKQKVIGEIQQNLAF